MSRSTQPIGVQRVAALFLAVVLGFGDGLSVVRTAVNKSDTTLITKAAAAGILEVQANQAAITRAGNPDVRALAQRMVKNHTIASNELKTLAGEKGIAVPESPPADECTKVNKFNALGGVESDKAYVGEVGVRAHREAVSLFDKAPEDARDPGIKAFFVHNPPALHEHLQMAEQLKTAAK